MSLVSSPRLTVSLIVSPTRLPEYTSYSLSKVSAGWPSTAVITSFSFKPAFAAGLFSVTAVTFVPGPASSP